MDVEDQQAVRPGSSSRLPAKASERGLPDESKQFLLLE
jgi:hypothetical protein